MRTQVGYIQGQGFLNNASSPTAGGSTEAVTGLPIATGTNSGDFLELTDVQALAASSNGLAANILTAGTGQTNGNFTVAASYGPAVLNYTIAGGLLTAATVSGANGIYTPTFVAANGGSAPTFTIAQGGTPGTVQTQLMTLFSGHYQRVKLSAGITGVSIGQALFWNAGDTTDPYPVTNLFAAGGTTTYDYAGTVIDPGTVGSQYCWIQNNGKCRLALNGAGAAGNIVGFPIATANQYPTSGSALATGTGVGVQLVAASGAGGTALVNVTREQTKF